MESPQLFSRRAGLCLTLSAYRYHRMGRLPCVEKKEVLRERVELPHQCLYNNIEYIVKTASPKAQCLWGGLSYQTSSLGM